jgi:hypothetical protein
VRNETLPGAWCEPHFPSQGFSPLANLAMTCTSCRSSPHGRRGFSGPGRPGAHR